jgi:hypothetical protein
MVGYDISLILIIYLGEQLGYKEPSDWYRLTSKDLQNNYGSRVLRSNRSPALFVMRSMPHHPWVPFRFNPSRSVMEGGPELVNYVERVEKELGIVKPEEWYRVGRAHMAKDGHCFSGIGDFVSKTLKRVYPGHVWEMHKFTQFSKIYVQSMLKDLLQRYFTSFHPFSPFSSSSLIQVLLENSLVGKFLKTICTLPIFSLLEKQLVLMSPFHP